MLTHVVNLCSNCPFRRGQSYLRRARAREIARNCASPSGKDFSCHKTVKHDEDGEPAMRSDELTCIGSMAFSLNAGAPNQMMRIAHRLGMVDIAAVEAVQPKVYGSVAEMVRGHGWVR